MITEEERRQFFATKKNLHTISMKGKSLHLANLPETDRKMIMDRLAEKDEIQKQGQLGILPGLKIDGKQVTKDNLHEFEIKPSEEIKKEKETKKTKEEEEIKYTKSELDKLSFKQLREIGNKLGTKGRGKNELIKEILNLQK